MPTINISGSAHGRGFYAGVQYVGYSPKLPYLKILQDAIRHIDRISKGMSSCNTCFKNLPGKKSFAEVWADKDIWISFQPIRMGKNGVDFWGITNKVGGKEIAITIDTFDKGFKFVAGTLVHELAHTNGAPVTTKQADATLLCCGVKEAYEGVIGVRQSGTVS